MLTEKEIEKLANDLAEDIFFRAKLYKPNRKKILRGNYEINRLTQWLIRFAHSVMGIEDIICVCPKTLGKSTSNKCLIHNYNKSFSIDSAKTTSIIWKKSALKK